ncbi:sirohydrochlorin cobaltochelatase [Desulfatibacillum alkenivorans DSM 16219]|jgi:sirohydrochlorin cobaltochelatase|uniref:Sirohydrochlorin cobaltochelatase n=1 Tax=Desulfatibacillum alkenivorans DSM 16219 TaxID=1121393 RepID=A0A1M6SIV7_9BACT|nr:sirohydrochlorin cobaltochelatase [Desulfatibacillum alkenivorans]SHK44671.1 sirohydrochlorin cobaltochelatase [Desulfatibacillum alkenivorans DSM 16219]
MNIPIILAAFGTSTRAMAAYDDIDAYYKKTFPGHDIHWAFTSRMVASKLRKKAGREVLHPYQVFDLLSQAGHEWAVLQSLHLTCGHEFYRLVDDAKSGLIRISMGLPLLSSPEDCMEVAGILEPLFQGPKDQAVVLVGHGTDHPAWSMYTAMASVLRKTYGEKAFVGVVEEGIPEQEDVVREVKDKGFKRVLLAPFMLVSGVHFEEDLAGEEDSWKSAFEEQGLQVELHAQGLGRNPKVTSLFSRHTMGALDMVQPS